MSCVILFGACIEGVVLRDKWVKFIRANLLLASIQLNFSSILCIFKIFNEVFELNTLTW